MDRDWSFGTAPSSSIESEVTSTKPKRPPTITPKRFTRFFTPRQSVNDIRKSKYASKAARTLRDITKNGINRKQTSPRRHVAKSSLDLDAENLTPRHKRRKLTPVLESSPIQLLSSPSKHARGDYRHIEILDEDAFSTEEEDIDEELHDSCDTLSRLPKPIRRLPGISGSHRLLERSFGGRSVLGRGKLYDSCGDWRYSTSDFYSYRSDVHSFDSDSLPFCTTACHTNSLVAIGLESGGITLVDSAVGDDIDFNKAHVSFKPHANAVMDICFSSDDYLMATASGDQTARVIDMRTQQTRYIMAGHVSSVKQVRFQPGNDSVLATSSRDGSVQIWDLRCRGTDVPAQEMHIAEDEADPSTWSQARKVVYADTCISIKDAHTSSLPVRRGADLFSTRTPAASKADVSITAINFLPQGREHLLLTASAVHASIKLWDIRGRYSSRSRPAVPVSSTAEPPSHQRSRRSGLTSLSLSTDGSRLFSTCRDSRVYAYSVPHLILGHAPEFSKPRTHAPSEAKQGLGPLYALAHPNMNISSFYIKAALRAARGVNEEMLAVGSRDENAVVFPTDERTLRRMEADDDDDSFPSLSRVEGREDIPVYTAGTPLVRGHGKEVTAVSWTNNGELITCSDDFSARVWREDGDRADRLRNCGEGEGERWRCGWAEEA